MSNFDPERKYNQKLPKNDPKTTQNLPKNDPKRPKNEPMESTSQFTTVSLNALSAQAWISYP